MKSDSFTAFVNCSIEENFDGNIPKRELKERYMKFCRERKIKPVYDKEIKETLYATYPISEEQASPDITGKRIRRWGCISWKE